MKKTVNKVILIGNVGTDPEFLYTTNGTAIAKIALATNHGWRDKETGLLNETVEWHQVIFFDRLAEIVDQILRKGACVYIEGRLKTHSWLDNAGVKHRKTEVIGSEMCLCKQEDGA